MLLAGPVSFLLSTIEPKITTTQIRGDLQQRFPQPSGRSARGLRKQQPPQRVDRSGGEAQQARAQQPAILVRHRRWRTTNADANPAPASALHQDRGPRAPFQGRFSIGGGGASCPREVRGCRLFAPNLCLVPLPFIDACLSSVNNKVSATFDCCACLVANPIRLACKRRLVCLPPSRERC